MDDSGGDDYYKVLGIEPTATSKEITKAYRLLALKYHPDKNPDKPDIVQLFHRITKAYDVLTDTNAKEAYDAVIKIQLDRRKRLSEMDEQRRKLREDLLERESAVKYQQQEQAQQRLRRELERLKDESARRQQEHEEEIRQMFYSKPPTAQQPPQSDASAADDSSTAIERAVKIKWKRKRFALDEALLCQLLQPYGPIERVVVSAKMNSAVVVFKSLQSACRLINQQKRVDELDSVEWAGGQEPEALRKQAASAQPPLPPPRGPYQLPPVEQQEPLEDYETATLIRLQQMAKRKRESPN